MAPSSRYAEHVMTGARKARAGISTPLCAALSSLAFTAAIVVGLGAPATPLASTSQTVLVSKCGQLGVMRPKSIVLTCGDAGLVAHHLHWQRWGGSLAVAHGEELANDCIPSCAGGHFVATPVTLHLYKRRGCPSRSHLYYRQATLIESGGHRLTQPLSCPY